MLNELSQAAYLLLLFIFIPVPYGTDRPIVRVPWVTLTLVALNSLVFLFLILPELGTPHENDIFDAYGLAPRQMNAVGLAAYMFLHVSLAHLLWNVAFLWLFGPSVEDAFGHFAFLLLFLFSGVAAGLLHVAIVLLFAANSAPAFVPLVGASGAIAAILGAFTLLFYRSRLRIIWVCAYFLELPAGQFELPVIAGLSLWLAQNLFGGIYALFKPDLNGIAYWAHIGGFIFGMTVAEFAGMMQSGVHEYLYFDAWAARSTTEDAGSFRLLLQRRPGEAEIRESLALLAQKCVSKGSASAFDTVGDAYAALLEKALAAGDVEKTHEWLAAFDDLEADNRIDALALVRLAEKAAASGNRALAERFYLKTIARFPGSDLAQQALLDAATLRLDQDDSPAGAIHLLLRSLPPTTA